MEILYTIAAISGTCLALCIIIGGIVSRAMKDVPKIITILIIFFGSIFLGAAFTIGLNEFQQNLTVSNPVQNVEED